MNYFFNLQRQFVCKKRQGVPQNGVSMALGILDSVQGALLWGEINGFSTPVV